MTFLLPLLSLIVRIVLLIGDSILGLYGPKMLSPKIRHNAERLARCQVQCDGKEREVFMNRKRWQKTVIEWDCSLGLETNVRVTDWHKPREKYVHKIHKIKATALPDRNGQVELQIFRVSICPTTERQLILSRLFEGSQKYRKALSRLNDGYDYIAVKDEGEHSSAFIIDFRLENGDHFCDIVIGIVREVFKILGVKDDKGYRLADFAVKQETYIRFEEAWITFASWLRIQHQLPPHTSADVRAA